MLVPVADLIGSPGASRPLHRTVAAGDVGDDPWGPIEEALRGDLVLDLVLDSVIEGIWVHGDIRWELELDCGRCLRPVRLQRHDSVGELFADERRIESPEDMDEGYTLLPDGNGIDLERMLHDVVVLDMPVMVRCGLDDCRTPEGGTVTVITEDEHLAALESAPDPRWAALADLDVAEG